MTEFLGASQTPLWIKPNAGVPTIVDGAAVYEVNPEMLAEHVLAYVARGARIVGWCCGTTPGHIAAIARALGR